MNNFTHPAFALKNAISDRPSARAEQARQLEIPTRSLKVPNGGPALSYEGPCELSQHDDHYLDAHLWRNRKFRLTVICSLDKTPKGLLMHVSVASRLQLPPWHIVTGIRDLFFPNDIDVMMVLPRAADYVNEHEQCLQMWQTPTVWGLR